MPPAALSFLLNDCGKNALRSKFAGQYGFAGIPKPPLAVPRTVRGGGIFEENAGGDMPQISECFLNLWRSNPLRPFGPFPLIGGIGPLSPRGAFGGGRFVGADAHSARWEVTNSPKNTVKPVYPAGGQSRPLLQGRARAVVGADDSVGPLGSYEFAADSRKVRCILPGRCVPASGRPTSVTLLRRERL